MLEGIFAWHSNPCNKGAGIYADLQQHTCCRCARDHCTGTWYRSHKKFCVWFCVRFTVLSSAVSVLVSNRDQKVAQRHLLTRRHGHTFPPRGHFRPVPCLNTRLRLRGVVDTRSFSWRLHCAAAPGSIFVCLDHAQLHSLQQYTHCVREDVCGCNSHCYILTKTFTLCT